MNLQLHLSRTKYRSKASNSSWPCFARSIIDSKIQILVTTSAQVARETLLNALVRFTLLDAARHMEDKNVRCVKVLLSLALTDGNLLRESWGLVLRCISQLAR